MGVCNGDTPALRPILRMNDPVVGSLAVQPEQNETV